MSYNAYDLNGELIARNVPSMRLLADCLGVSEDTVKLRVKRKVTKFDKFIGDKYKFNVERVECQAT